MSREVKKMGHKSADIMYMSQTKIKVGHKRRNIVHMSQTKTKAGHRKEDSVHMSSNVQHRTCYLYKKGIGTLSYLDVQRKMHLRIVSAFMILTKVHG